MKVCSVRDLPPIPADVEERALAARMASSSAREEPGDSIELLEALLDIGRQVIAEKEAADVAAYREPRMG